MGATMHDPQGGNPGRQLGGVDRIGAVAFVGLDSVHSFVEGTGVCHAVLGGESGSAFRKVLKRELLGQTFAMAFDAGTMRA